MNEKGQLQQAVSLSRWLIEEQKTKPKTAYIIAMRKYKLDSYVDVQREYNRQKALRKPKQEKLII